jgi:TolB-like protein
MKKTLVALALSTLAITGANASSDTNKHKDVEIKQHSYNTAGIINQLVKFLADQLSANKDFKNIQQSSIAIASFVNMENIKETNKLGNLISENLIHDMQVRGYRVVDFKMMPTLRVGKKGDYVYSRNADQLSKSLNINYVLSGTYTTLNDGCTINARLVNMKTKVVVSTAQAFIDKKTLQSILIDTKEAIYDRVEYKTKYVIPDVEPYIVDIEVD